jgi:hypothetical protein
MQKKITLLILGYLISLVTLNAQGWEEITKTVPVETDAAGYNYGYSVSIDGDYAIVGAYGYNSSQGMVYVLYNNGTDWESIAQLTASDGETSDWFGRAVSMNGNTIVVGAYGDDDNGSNSGSAYVFTKPDGGWVDMTQTAKLLPSDGADDDRFGLRVSINDNTIVIGAYNDDDNGTDSGSAYVFTKPSEGWVDMTQTAKLIASDGAEDDGFGISVGVSDSNIVIGAFQNNEKANNSGAAYVFTKPNGGWIDTIQTAKLTASDALDYATFGNSVSIFDNNIVIGAYHDSDKGAFSGSAYVFTKPDGGWADMTQTAKLNASDASSYDSFGQSVCICGDSIVIGASDDDNKGATYVFIKPDGGWTDTTEIAKIIASDGDDDDRFGWSVGISGDNVVVGAHKDDDNGNKCGSAYFIKLLPPMPEISIKQGDTEIANGETYDFGELLAESNSDTILFTIANQGWLDLTLIGSPLIELTGANASDFNINQTEINDTLAPGDSTTFTIVFSPSLPGASVAEISIINNDSNENPYIISLTGTAKLNQSIIFSPLADMTYGDNSYTLAATASSGLNMEFSSSNIDVAACSGTTLTIVGAGNCTISANQTGDATYFAAPQVEQSLTIIQKELTVTADSQTMIQGNELPTLTMTYEGFVNSDSENELDIMPIASTTASASSEVGDYTITVSGGSDNNYLFTYIEGTLTISSGSSIVAESSNMLVEVYPNPANNVVKIALPKSITNASIELYNSAGAKLMELETYGNVAEIDITHLQQGIYVFKITSDTQNATVRWIKE